MEKHLLYNGTVELLFDAGKHLYLVNLAPKLGVTTATGCLDKSNGLIPWAVGNALDVVEAHIKPGVPLDEVQIKEMVAEAKSSSRKRRDSAADLGTLAHEWIERYIKWQLKVKGFEEPEDPVNETLKMVVGAFLNFVKEKKVKFIASEVRLYSKEYDYCGTADIICEIDGELCLLDIKVSSGFYNEHRYQTAGYQIAYTEQTGQKIIRRWVIRLDKQTGDFDPHPIDKRDNPKDAEAFLGLLRVAKREKELKKVWRG